MPAGREINRPAQPRPVNRLTNESDAPTVFCTSCQERGGGQVGGRGGGVVCRVEGGLGGGSLPRSKTPPHARHGVGALDSAANVHNITPIAKTYWCVRVTAVVLGVRASVYACLRSHHSPLLGQTCPPPPTHPARKDACHPRTFSMAVNALGVPDIRATKLAPMITRQRPTVSQNALLGTGAAGSTVTYALGRWGRCSRRRPSCRPPASPGARSRWWCLCFLRSFRLSETPSPAAPLALDSRGALGPSVDITGLAPYFYVPTRAQCSHSQQTNRASRTALMYPPHSACHAP
jgi:hypothetical protein